MINDEPPLTRREKYAEAQSLAKLKEEERLERNGRKGYFRVTLLPAVTYTMAGIILCLSLRWLVINPVQENKEKSYNGAYSAFVNGDYKQAAEHVRVLVEKNPADPSANILMARIELARGRKQSAIDCLRNAREAHLERKEIDRWIADLESFSSGSHSK